VELDFAARLHEPRGDLALGESLTEVGKIERDLLTHAPLLSTQGTGRRRRAPGPDSEGSRLRAGSPDKARRSPSPAAPGPPASRSTAPRAARPAPSPCRACPAPRGPRSRARSCAGTPPAAPSRSETGSAGRRPPAPGPP